MVKPIAPLQAPVEPLLCVGRCGCYWTVRVAQIVVALLDWDTGWLASVYTGKSLVLTASFLSLILSNWLSGWLALRCCMKLN